MNILQIGSYLYPDLPGGAEISAQNVATALEAAGHRVTRLRWKRSGRFRPAAAAEQVGASQWAIATWRPYTPLETKRGIHKFAFYGMELFSPVSRRSIQSLIDAEGIEVLIVHSFRGIGYDLLRKVAGTDVPVVIFLHDFALTCINKGRFRAGAACQSLCAECRYLSQRNSRHLSQAARVYIVGPSRQIVEKTKVELNLPQAHYAHIPNPNEYTVRGVARTAPDRFSLGYVGRLERDKGVSELLKVADSLHRECGIAFEVAGDGALAELVTEFARTRPWVTFHGYVSPAEIVSVYDRIDILAMPSLWAENFSGSVVQALGNGVPAVGFNIGGVPEVIRNGQTGAIVEPGDFRALEGAIKAIISDTARYEELSRGSIEIFKEYDARNLRDRIVRLVEGARDGNPI